MGRRAYSGAKTPCVTYYRGMLLIERMRQMGPNRWSFEPPDEPPMKGDCPVCGRRVVVLRPRVTNVTVGYLVEGECADCGGAPSLSVP